MIFIDADAYLALTADDDVHHKNAKRIFARIEENHEELVTSWEVIDEVTTKLARFTSQKIGIGFLARILSSDIRIEYVTSVLVPSIQSLFAKQTSKKVSLTDCANMVIARSLGIKTFFSFDHHYEQNGFRLLTSDRPPR